MTKSQQTVHTSLTLLTFFSLCQEGQTCCFVRLLLRFYVERVFSNYASTEPQQQRSTSALANAFVSIRRDIHKCVSSTWKLRQPKTARSGADNRTCVLCSTATVKKRPRELSTPCMLSSSRYGWKLKMFNMHKVFSDYFYIWGGTITTHTVWPSLVCLSICYCFCWLDCCRPNETKSFYLCVSLSTVSSSRYSRQRRRP